MTKINNIKNAKKKNTHWNTTHGASASSIYFVYHMINQRCENKNNKGYKNYGGRGIKNMWKSFGKFYDDMAKSYKKGLTIDRIDNNGNYCKENCRWIPRSAQNSNRRSNIKFEGICITNIGKLLGGGKSLVGSRLRKGWSLEDACKYKPYESK